jgi:hypothetical protein
MIEFAINSNYPDLEKDFPLWDEFIKYLKQCDAQYLFANTAPDKNWDSLSLEMRGNVLDAILRGHQKIFGYEATDIMVTERAGAGFWMNIFNENLDTIDYTESLIEIPRAGKTESFQLFISSIARNFLMDNFVKERCSSTKLMGEIKDYNITLPGIDFDKTRLAIFPMPSEFKDWFDRPSMRYGLQAASYVSGQIGGQKNIADELAIRLFQNFMDDQHFILTALLTNDDRINETNFYQKLWQERAQDYIDVIARNAELIDIKNAIEIMQFASDSGIEITPTKELEYFIQNHPRLHALTLKDDLSVGTFISKQSYESLLELDDDTRLHLLRTLTQTEIESQEQQKMQEASAFALLASWEVSGAYLGFYEHVIQQMSQQLRKDPEINELGQSWMNTRHFDSRWTFILTLAEKMAPFLELPPIPIYQYEQHKSDVTESQNLNDKDALGCYISGFNVSLKNKFNFLNIPENMGPDNCIGLNISPEFALFSQATPEFVAQVLAHEMAHGVDDENVKRYRKADFTKDDPRYDQSARLNLLDRHKATDTILRNKFSTTIYPLIHTERFEYWFMDEFLKARPFSFLDPK